MGRGDYWSLQNKKQKGKELAWCRFESQVTFMLGKKPPKAKPTLTLFPPYAVRMSPGSSADTCIFFRLQHGSGLKGSTGWRNVFMVLSILNMTQECFNRACPGSPTPLSPPCRNLGFQDVPVLLTSKGKGKCPLTTRLQLAT